MADRSRGKGRSAALFDFDLTLMDTSYIITECTNRLAGRFDLRPVTHQEMKSLIGLPIEDEWVELWGRFEQEWLDYYRNNFRSAEMSGFREFPDTRSALLLLRSKGVRTGVVTNRHFARLAVEQSGIADLLDVVVGLEDAANPKPHPEPLLEALSRLEAAPEDAFYTGDTDIDMKTASAAGVTGIGVATGNFSRGELKESGAAYACSDLTEAADTILKIIERS
ncbi:MAG: HAD family hydrolase [Synergistaceae bacterium]|jgi:HAD superfamily hydrolase (TIGR01549 family)|nr:HAD family hydrolase [Synergistaceae bacterium]